MAFILHGWQPRIEERPEAFELSRSGAAADRRAVLKLGAQLDLTSSYSVPRTGRMGFPIISPMSLNYAKLCVELNHTGTAIGEMWGDLATRHIAFEQFMLNQDFPRFRRESICDRHIDGIDSALKGRYLERQESGGGQPPGLTPSTPVQFFPPYLFSPIFFADPRPKFRFFAPPPVHLPPAPRPFFVKSPPTPAPLTHRGTGPRPPCPPPQGT